MDEAAKLLNATNVFVGTLIEAFGPLGTVGVALGAYVLFFLLRCYKDWQRERQENQVIDEKERVIQRLNNENRQWRAVFMKEKCGWTDEQVEKFIIHGDFADGPSARKALESKPSGKERT